MTHRWAAMTYGNTRKIKFARWQMKVFGAVVEEIQWTYELNNIWIGVSAREVMKQIKIAAQARCAMAGAYGQYEMNLP